MRTSYFAVLGAWFVMACGSVKGSPDAAIDAPTACPVGETAVCSGTDLLTCDGQGNVTNTTSCALGCNATEKRCNKVSPSNGLASFLDEAENAADLELMGAATIDTDAGTITDATGPRTPATSTVTTGVPVPVLVIKVKSFTAVNVTVTGTRALAIVSHGTVTLNGTFSVSARADLNGPGAVPADTACRGGNAAAGNPEGQAGGGGGGFGTAGGRGGTGGSPTVQGGAPGAAGGAIELVPLRGGCPGGRASNQGANFAAGGGGGAVQIVSNTSIVIADNGKITSNGGGGKGPVGPIFCIVNTPCGNGEGGGSGGAILLEAPIVTVAATGGIFANGGGGSCGVYGSGQSGQASTMVATGQTCGGQTGNGGNGGAAAVPAQNGGNTTGADAVGGGAGGGVGRIRVNLPNGTTFAPLGDTSGALSGGVLLTR